MSDLRISATPTDHRGASIAASDLLAQLCGEIAGAVKRTWGRGPVKTTAHWAGANMLVVVMENGHTDHEKALRAGGHIQHLCEGRRVLQRLLEDELTAIVQKSTGRRVITMLSATRLDPDLTAEVFLLAAAPGAQQHPSITLRARHAPGVAREQNEAAETLRAESDHVKRKNRQLRQRAD